MISRHLRPVVLVLAVTAVAFATGVDSSATSIARVLRIKSKDAGPWFRVYRQGHWGFADRTGRMMLPARYDDAEDFFEGLAAVQVGDVWGYVTERGHFAIRPRFQKAGRFDGGRAVVRLQDRDGVIDTSGVFVVPPVYGDVFAPTDGVAVTQLDGRYRIVGRDGREVPHPPFVSIGWTFVDGLTEACVAPGHLALFGMQETGSRACGYVDATGSFVVPPGYDDARPFSGGVARVWKQPFNAFGLIDARGTMLRGFDLLEVAEFSEGLAFARDRDGSGYVRTDGTWAFRVDVLEGAEFSQGLVAVRTPTGRSGYLDTQGRIAIEAQFDGADQFSEGLAAVRIDDHWGYVDRAGRLVVPVAYDHAYPFVHGLALVGTGGTFDYIDRRGRAVMSNVCDPDDVTPMTVC